jgi:hypothetical protein
LTQLRAEFDATVPQLPEQLGVIRKGIANEGGATVVDGDVQIKGISDTLRYLPRGLTVLLFDPIPLYDRAGAATGTAWNFHGRNGSFRQFASLEMLILYCLYPALLVALRNTWSRRDQRLWLILLATALPAAAYAVAIPNVGTLFRLRGQLIIPLIVLIAGTGGFTVYQRLWLLLRRRLLQQRVASGVAQEM